MTFDRSNIRIVEVHGFNVLDGGRGSIGRLGEGLEALGYQVDHDTADYGYFNLFMIRFAKWSQYRKDIYTRLIGAFTNADVIITHSNGANFATQALYDMWKMKPRRRVLIHYSAALDRDTEIPVAVNMQVNYCTPYDWVVKLSALIPFYEWGSMGAHGYSGRGPNLNLFWDGKRIPHKVKGHSGWFKDEHIQRILESTDSQIQLHLTPDAGE